MTKRYLFLSLIGLVGLAMVAGQLIELVQSQTI